MTLELQLTVPNMACSTCSNTITKAIIAINPTATIQADSKTKLVYIETQASEAAVKQATTKRGYSVA